MSINFVTHSHLASANSNAWMCLPAAFPTQTLSMLITKVNVFHYNLICTSWFPRAALSWFSFYLTLILPLLLCLHLSLLTATLLLTSPQLFSVLSCYRLVLWPFPLSCATWITDLYQLGGLFPNFSLRLPIAY